jgi:protein gp37
MGEKTGIEFADKTWNPWQGCAKVSPGCDNCYMFREKKMYGQDPETVIRSKPPTFNAPLKWAEPEIVFTASWSDWFIREADDWRAEAWDIIRRTPHLFYLVFTKRPQNIPDRLPPDWGSGYPNVMLVVTTENQEEADRRIPKILRIPAAYRGISAEPLLGPMDIEPYLWPQCIATKEEHDRDHDHGLWCDERSLDWVVVGGESGPRSRPMHPDWVSSIRDQCRQSSVPFFFKQWGEWVPSVYVGEGRPVGIKTVLEERVLHRDGCICQHDVCFDQRGMARVGKKNAGRLLDGREWSEFPAGVPRGK